ncbi:sigma-70 family RNA polymerase sigma factor [Microcoleus sp. LAD1_D1]|uniref:sigma-70 family RNA polymerase sigma factor n=1 Tax=Microcoleus sp. LAD1_D1 TaxID=2818812 RepID=UPI002FD374AA
MDKSQNNELDEQLKQLAISAQQHPALTQGRQLALRKLVNGIVQSGRLCRPQRGQFSGSYEDIYNEAVQELLLYICQNVEKYDPERGSVMAWVNVLLERRFFKEAIPKILGKPNLQKMTLSDLDNLAPPEETESLTEILKECIESDPDNLFKKEYLQNYPAANFQVLLQRRFSGKSWKEISAEFDINIKTLSSFYYRCVNKFSSRLREYCLTS